MQELSVNFQSSHGLPMSRQQSAGISDTMRSLIDSEWMFAAASIRTLG